MAVRELLSLPKLFINIPDKRKHLYVFDFNTKSL